MDLVAELLGQSELEIAVPQRLSVVLPQQVQPTSQLGLAAHPEPIVVARLLDGLTKERDAGPAVATDQVVERQLGQGLAADLGRRIGFEQLLRDSSGSMEIAGGGRVAGLGQPSSGQLVRTVRRRQVDREGSQLDGRIGCSSGTSPFGRRLESRRDRLLGSFGRKRQMTGPLLGIGHDLGQAGMDLATPCRCDPASRRGRTEWVDEPDPIPFELNDPCIDRRVQRAAGRPVDDVSDDGEARCRDDRSDGQQFLGLRW